MPETAHPAKALVSYHPEHATREGIDLLVVDDGIEKSIEDLAEGSIHIVRHGIIIKDADYVDAVVVTVFMVDSNLEVAGQAYLDERVIMLPEDGVDVAGGAAVPRTIDEMRNHSRCGVDDPPPDGFPGLSGILPPELLDVRARAAETLGLELDRRRTTEDERPTRSRMGGASSCSSCGSGSGSGSIGLIRGGRSVLYDNNNNNGEDRCVPVHVSDEKPHHVLQLQNMSRYTHATKTAQKEYMYVSIAHANNSYTHGTSNRRGRGSTGIRT